MPQAEADVGTPRTLQAGAICPVHAARMDMAAVESHLK